jgi:hypothetical protein
VGSPEVILSLVVTALAVLIMGRVVLHVLTEKKKPEKHCTYCGQIEDAEHVLHCPASPHSIDPRDEASKAAVLEMEAAKRRRAREQFGECNEDYPRPYDPGA